MFGSAKLAESARRPSTRLVGPLNERGEAALLGACAFGMKVKASSFMQRAVP
jgi:hypothetical protein